ncbi:MAG: hypothetical protein IKR57_00265 [Bacilli bacterium]|nr:hypothetical protein [Bacilli bacterium]
MENLTNQVLRLEDNTRYFVLRQAVYKGKTYFLGAELTPDGEDFTNQFVFLEKVDGEELEVQVVTDKEIIEVLAKNIKIE